MRICSPAWDPLHSFCSFFIASKYSIMLPSVSVSRWSCSFLCRCNAIVARANTRWKVDNGSIQWYKPKFWCRVLYNYLFTTGIRLLSSAMDALRRHCDKPSARSCDVYGKAGFGFNKSLCCVQQSTTISYNHERSSLEVGDEDVSGMEFRTRLYPGVYKCHWLYTRLHSHCTISSVIHGCAQRHKISLACHEFYSMH
jgi:hypothetical protein